LLPSDPHWLYVKNVWSYDMTEVDVEFMRGTNPLSGGWTTFEVYQGGQWVANYAWDWWDPASVTLYFVDPITGGTPWRIRSVKPGFDLDGDEIWYPQRGLTVPWS
jgi:hypothetical protein